MERAVTPISIAGSQLGELRHICAFFNSDEEEYRLLLPFIQDGFRRGDKAVHIVNPEQKNEHVQRLIAAEIDVNNAFETGQLDLRTNTETYLIDGRFNPERMLQSFEAIASTSDNGQLSRILCRMDWASTSEFDTLDLIEFESRVNRVWERHDDAVICTYHLPKFGGETVVDIMRTHPMIIIGGIVQQNPFYVPPDLFLSEIRERRSQRSDAAGPGA